MVAEKVKTICPNCIKERLVGRAMMSLIRSGKSTGKCRSCNLLGTKRSVGRIVSVETREKKRLAALGKSLTPEHRQNISKGKKGLPLPHATAENNYRWIKDRSLVRVGEKRSGSDPNYKQWKRAVHKRDGCKCKINNAECGGRTETHHILNWKDYPELRYDINNGITLCHSHHPRRRVEEQAKAAFFKALITSSN